MDGYFACPLASGRNREMALAIVELIERFGHKILDRHVVAEEGKGKEEFCKNSGISPENFNPQSVRKQDLEWIMRAGFVVLEYMNGSWGGGIEFDHATVIRELLGLNQIPILCLLRAGATPSWMILGIDSKKFPKVWLMEYRDIIDMERIIEHFLKYFCIN